MEIVAQETGLNFKETELRLGLPGTDDKQSLPTFKNNKRSSPDDTNDTSESKVNSHAKPAFKAQVVGWPPIRNYRKNSIQQKKDETESGVYVKVSLDGAPYLRKIDLKGYNGYSELLKALENMFKLTIGKYSEREGYNGSEFSPTYEDKDGDWMLVGDVPWEMFSSSCKRLRIMKASEARGLGCGECGLHICAMYNGKIAPTSFTNLECGIYFGTDHNRKCDIQYGTEGILQKVENEIVLAKMEDQSFGLSSPRRTILILNVPHVSKYSKDF